MSELRITTKNVLSAIVGVALLMGLAHLALNHMEKQECREWRDKGLDLEGWRLEQCEYHKIYGTDKKQSGE